MLKIRTVYGVNEMDEAQIEIQMKKKRCMKC